MNHRNDFLLYIGIALISIIIIQNVYGIIKGADVSFMEHTRKYHGRPPNEDEYEAAIKELEDTRNNIN